MILIESVVAIAYRFRVCIFLFIKLVFYKVSLKSIKFSKNTNAARVGTRYVIIFGNFVKTFKVSEVQIWALKTANTVIYKASNLHFWVMVQIDSDNQST